MSNQAQTDRLVFCGGHAATTAISTIEEFKKRPKASKYDLVWIGSTSSVEGKKIVGIEAEVLPTFGVDIQTISAGRIQRKFTKNTIPSLLKIPIGIFQAFLLLQLLRPKLVVSFGGYAAFPVVFGAYFLRIPVILHEQTVAVGLANKVSAWFANKIAISRPESQKFFPSNKTVLTGNPILSEYRNVKAKKTLGSPPTIMITGGSRGAHIVNRAIDKSLDKLLVSFRLIHQTGPIDYSYFMDKREKMSSAQKEKYRVYSTINPLNMWEYYKQCDIYIGRSGANTVAEVLTVKRPAIFIPIPWSRYDEQNKNAQRAQSLGVATIIKQDALTPSKVLETVEYTLENWNKMNSNFNSVKSEDLDAAKKLVDLLLTYL